MARPQYSSPLSYEPDTLNNNEIGFKSEFLDHRLQFNASVVPDGLARRAIRALRPDHPG